MVAHEGVGVQPRAPASGRIDVALYPCLTNTAARVRQMTWDELGVALDHHEEREGKDGPLWSPVRFRKGAPKKRADVNVDTVTALVFDFDHLEPAWALLDGLSYHAHTTYKHHSGHPECGVRLGCPHWRVVVQVAEPIPSADYPEARRRATFWLAPDTDPSCKDESRANYLPSCPPEAARATRHGDGAPLDWRDLPAIPDELQQDRRRPAPARHEGPAGGDRPGDRFSRETDWADILEPAGFTCVATLSDGVRRWRRPGKREGWSATTGGGGFDVLYMFTSNAPPFEGHTSYSKFRAYSLLRHGGDDKAAARTLAERYGNSEHRNGHAASPPPPNGAAHHDADVQPRRFNLTDTGNAERLRDRHGADLRFCHPWGTWLHWDGKRWKRDTTGTVRRWAKDVVRSIYAEASAIENDAERAAVAGWAKRSESATARAAMVKLAEVEPGIPIEPDEMDANPFLLNILNGTLDLRSGQLRAHDRRDNITKLAPVYYDPTAECPTFLAFLERTVPDPEVRAFLQRASGYGMTGDTTAQALFFFHGGGANGKSTLLSVLQALLGDYAKQAAPELLVSRGGDRHPTELADLFGARFVTSIEIDEGKRLAETLVKQMTGGDSMKARFMRTDFFQWQPTHKVFLAANHRPEIRGTDLAIWRRIHLVPFTVTIPEDERDPRLPSKLLAELPGILNWALAGCLDWQRKGLGMPQAVRNATEEYRAEQDLLADFLTDCCVMDPQAYAVSGALYKAYTSWCDAGGTKPIISNTALGRRLTERGFRSDSPWIGGKRVRVWRGLGLLTPSEEPDRNAFDPRNASGRDFPDNNSPIFWEVFTKKNVSNPVRGSKRFPGLSEASGGAELAELVNEEDLA